VGIVTRAKKICSYVGPHGSCINLQPCPIHARKPWAGSAYNRGDKSLLSGSARQKRARFVITRADTICHRCHRPGADTADHLIALAHGGADDVSNMAAIHGGPDSCHSEKSRLEARGMTPTGDLLGATSTATRGLSDFQKSGELA